MGGPKNVRRRRLYRCTRQVGLCPLSVQWRDWVFSAEGPQMFAVSACGVLVSTPLPTKSRAEVGGAARTLGSG